MDKKMTPVEWFAEKTASLGYVSVDIFNQALAMESEREEEFYRFKKKGYKTAMLYNKLKEQRTLKLPSEEEIEKCAIDYAAKKAINGVDAKIVRKDFRAGFLEAIEQIKQMNQCKT